MEFNQLNLKASFLDRLIDEEPNQADAPVQESLVSVGQIKASVIRDLENLLNTKRRIHYVSPNYREVLKSGFIYGLSDYTASNPGSVTVKQQLRQEIEKVISMFEPRLQNVTVQIDTDGKKFHALRFRINAVLVIDPIKEPVSFDTYFDAVRGIYRITR
jgi:type VI secretion system protein ImpF